ncbi:uracil-xanthine permease family protein [Campylobacter geochelonis]|uniref:Uracil permease n=1 Tax=Campylobacter geochelonis TaxID=1780362 RepID=A0A128EE51_9BACT|nr:uracil-xanthine permease family protein [Campylobacter geochelonis]QKF72116.1 xanthine/uracil permease [Campylobacter geochelonis]CZE46702.1 uracil permease [Campylobacter geochelonis]
MSNPSIEYNFRLKDSLLGVQFLFVAFGALVLMPILTGLDTSVALFTAGVGTLIFQFICRKKVVPIFLASSFAFIAPISFAVEKWGLSAAMGGVVFAGLAYTAFSFVVRYKGASFVHKILPAVVVGPVIMTIGLILSPSAVGMATASGDMLGAYQALNPHFSANDAMIIAGVSLLVTLICIMFAKGMMKLVPILCGVSAGYILSCFYGIVDFSKVASAPWFAMPNFTTPTFQLDAILYMIPVIIAPIIEHIGNVIAIGNVTKYDFVKKPGLENTLLGDGIATTVAAFVAGPPCTTYAEVTGAVRLTRAFNPAIMTWSAIAAILLAFVSKLGALIASIPACVLGGIMILLFGIIASVGMETLIKAKVDMANPRNMVIIALILVPALGGMILDLGVATFSQIGLGAVVGVVLNLVLPHVENAEELDLPQVHELADEKDAK